MADKKKIVVICGPTASGKTGLALEIAKRFDGEIISADSMQIYKGLDIGTAKATRQEQRIARHHLVDILSPEQPYNAQLFVQMASRAIEDISSRGKLPIIAGGTGLYIESLLNGIKFSRQPDNTAVKEKIQKIYEEKGGQYLYSLLQEIDPDYAAKVHPNNVIRVMRAIEIYHLTGRNMSYQIANSRPVSKPYDSLIIGLGFKDRNKLYENINKRVDIMMSLGILPEAEYVYKNKDKFKTCVNAIGYKEFFGYFDGTSTLEECVEKLKQASRNYAKRQMTWFNRMDDVNWLFADETDCRQAAVDMVNQFTGRCINGKSENQ